MKALMLIVVLSLVPGQAFQSSNQNPQPTSPGPAAPPAATQDNQQLGLRGPVPAEAVFKDMDIFKGKAAERLMPALQAISGSLGVPCVYCHTQYEWEKNDKPPKQTTRKMFRMIGFINEKYFPGENKVSCC